MAVNGQNIYQPARPPNVETLSQQFEAFTIARRKTISVKSENAADEIDNKGDSFQLSAFESASSKICYGKPGPSLREEQKPSPCISLKPGPSPREQMLTPCISQKPGSSPQEEQKPSPCISQKPGSSPQEEQKPSPCISLKPGPSPREQMLTPCISQKPGSSPQEEQKPSPCISQKPGSSPQEEQKPSPCISQKPISFTPSFRFVRPPNIYSWIRGQASNLLPSSSTPKIYGTNPSLVDQNHNGNFKLYKTPVASSSSGRSVIPSITPTPYISSPYPAKQTISTILKEFASPDSSNPHLLKQDRITKKLESPAVSPTSQVSSISPKAALENMYTRTEDENDPNSPPQTCSCQRSLQLILCRSCGNVLTGRIRKKCKFHPNQVFLMDILCCGECESRNLKEISSAKPSPST